MRREKHPDRVVTYIIDRNVNYTNFCNAFCSFCAFYRPPHHEEGWTLPYEAIEKKVERKRRQMHVPGASLVIVKDDQVIYLKGLGDRDRAERLPVTADTLFAIGSRATSSSPGT